MCELVSGIVDRRLNCQSIFFRIVLGSFLFGQKKRKRWWASLPVSSSNTPRKAIGRTLLLGYIVSLHKNMTYVIKFRFYDIVSLNNYYNGKKHQLL